MVKRTNTCLTNLGNEFGHFIYDVYDGDSTGVLCLHDKISNRSIFNNLSEELGEAVTVVVPDMVGRAHSSYAPDYSMDRLVGDCINVMNAANMDRVVWVGAGLGAIVGMTVATMKNSPIVGLVLDNPIHSCDYAGPIDAVSEQAKFYSIELLAKQIQSCIKDSKYSLHDYVDYVIHHYKFGADSLVPTYDSSCLVAYDIDVLNLLTKVSQPVLLLSKSAIIDQPNVSFKESDHEFRLNYSERERKMITKWIYNTLKPKNLIKTHFAIESGVSVQMET